MNLKTNFEKYLNEIESYASRLERLYDEVESGMMRESRILEWMQAAYEQGCKDMAQDTLDTLGDYATALAGISDIVYTRESAHDAVRVNLIAYYDMILKSNDET